jgi:hypothetical protein
LCAVGVGGGGDESSGFHAAFSFDRIEPDEIEGDVFEHGQVVSCGPGAGAHLVVVEGYIHGPVQAVLDGPVGTDSLGDARGIWARLLM